MPAERCLPIEDCTLAHRFDFSEDEHHSGDAKVKEVQANCRVN